MRGLPQVNLNGTSRQALVDQRIAASEAIHVALQALREMTPHGRDYQHSPAAYEVAVAVHRARYAALEGVYADLVQEAVALASES